MRLIEYLKEYTKLGEPQGVKFTINGDTIIINPTTVESPGHVTLDPSGISFPQDGGTVTIGEHTPRGIYSNGVYMDEAAFIDDQYDVISERLQEASRRMARLTEEQIMNAGSVMERVGDQIRQRRHSVEVQPYQPLNRIKIKTTVDNPRIERETEEIFSTDIADRILKAIGYETEEDTSESEDIEAEERELPLEEREDVIIVEDMTATCAGKYIGEVISLTVQRETSPVYGLGSVSPAAFNHGRAAYNIEIDHAEVLNLPEWWTYRLENIAPGRNRISIDSSIITDVEAREDEEQHIIYLDNYEEE